MQRGFGENRSQETGAIPRVILLARNVGDTASGRMWNIQKLGDLFNCPNMQNLDIELVDGSKSIVDALFPPSSFQDYTVPSLG